MSSKIPLCNKCDRLHWGFWNCDEAREIESKKDSPDIYADWSDRDTFKPYGARGQENRIYGGRLTVLKAKDKQ